MRVLYLDCFSGIAGDMFLGALLDAGVPLEVVTGPLSDLGLEGWSVEAAPAMRGSLRASRAVVSVEEQEQPRTISEIESLLAHLPETVGGPARRVFRALGEAEARVHGIPVEEVHFHEVGALDAIVDVVGTCAALAHLAPGRIVCSPLVTGRGITSGAHGPIPVPAPAVVELLARRGAPLASRGDEELVTPTGAALVCALAEDFGAVPEMSVERVGYGAGAKDLAIPNVLRVLIGERIRAEPEDRAVLIETNLDDAAPEIVSHAVSRLLAAGAHDAWATPIVMKKGRPAVTLSVLAAPEDRRALTDLVFSETTTLGVRVTSVEKHALERDWMTVDLDGWSVRVKLGLRSGEIATMAPEYDDAEAAAAALGLPLKEVYARAVARARAQLFQT